MGGMGAMVEMDVGSLRLYLQNIEEYVMDEDKIVTYKWLSKNLDIHVNTAKQLLYTFATEQKDDVHLTYLVGGVLCDGTGCKIQIVRQEDLEKAKAEFKALTSEHVYSVQKARTLPDLGALYAVDVHMRDENEDDKRVTSSFLVKKPPQICQLFLKTDCRTLRCYSAKFSEVPLWCFCIS
ncbi:hypothetical protein B7P43_G03826 [Cryptotermes secundus]|uniref:DNA polymerase delta subunit 3 n=1 Tax=Cryptotermes secundus TaxID=105785 RepID=A0A2J7QAG5_9NEOP|nr:hypothetical protein B7P43_G03826 [Cryptotermes secundus]